MNTSAPIAADHNNPQFSPQSAFRVFDLLTLGKAIGKLRAVSTQGIGMTKQDGSKAETAVEQSSSRASSGRVTNTVEGRPLEVSVDERGLERAIRRLKRKIDTEGVTRELKRRRHYEKPSVRKRRKAREAERRRRRRDRRLSKKP